MNTNTDLSKPDLPGPSSHYQQLIQLIHGYRITQMIHTAATLGIADLLADGPRHSRELAAAVGVHAPSLYRILRALASVGVFAEDDQGRFSLTPLAEPLRAGSTYSARDWAIFLGEEQHWRAWEQLLYSVRTGETGYSKAWGMQNWEYRAKNSQANQTFNAAMNSTAYARINPVIAAYDFSSIHTIVDVGGGQGTFIAAILQQYPGMRGVLYDLPHVVEGAANLLQKAGVANRCEIVSGNFFDSLPAGGDAYLLSRVVHDWDDQTAILILKTCRQNMQTSNKILLVEAVIPPGNTPHPAKLLDINMLVNNAGGRERTETEFRVLLDAAGFELSRVVPASGETSVVEGTAV